MDLEWLDKLLTVGGPPCAIILSVGAVFWVVGVKVVLPFAKIILESKREDTKAAVKHAEMAVELRAASEAGRETIKVADSTVKSAEFVLRVAQRFLRQVGAADLIASVENKGTH